MIFGEYRQGLLRDQSTSETIELHEAYRKLRKLAREHSRADHLRDREQRILDVIAQRLDRHDFDQSRHCCPECAGQMSVLKAGGAEVDCCRRCHSIWLDGGELKRLTGLGVDVPGVRLHHRPSKLCCPVCGDLMTEYQFCQGNNLMVDSCPARHGVYLQQGELERAFLASHITT